MFPVRPGTEGVHDGIVEQRENTSAGDEAREPARSSAPGGGIVVTEEGRPTPLPDGVGLSDLGDHDLRDLDRPLRLYRVDFTL